MRMPEPSELGSSREPGSSGSQSILHDGDTRKLLTLAGLGAGQRFAEFGCGWGMCRVGRLDLEPTLPGSI